MAGGPISPYSIAHSTGNYPTRLTGGSNSHAIFGVGVVASLGADSILSLEFALPPTLPSGTCKLVAQAIANATSNAAKFNPKWASVAATENPLTATLTAEGTQTVTWAAGNDFDIMETKVTLDADTPVAGERIVMNLTFETSSWTLAVVSLWNFWIIFE